jgi:phosphoglycolate phosphatase
MTVNGKPRLAVFDCDGTLVDSQHVIVACMHKAFSGEGLTAPTLADVRRIIGLPLAECVARLAPGEEALRVDRLVEAYKEAFFAIRQQPEHSEPLFEGALAALDAVEAEGWLLGIATGKSKRGLLAVLEQHGLVRRFVTLQTGDMGPGKPDPAMLERAMEETGVAREDMVMIGDTTFDMLMARNARVHALGVAWGYHAPEELQAAGAHALVTAFPDLPEAVFRYRRAPPCV